LRPEECLRIRLWNDRAEVTWKPPTSTAMREADQYWKEEVNWTGAITRKLLARLESRSMQSLISTGETFVVDEQSIVCFDKIDGLGWFVEVETKDHDSQAAVARNLGFNSYRRAFMSGLDDFRLMQLFDESTIDPYQQTKCARALEAVLATTGWALADVAALSQPVSLLVLARAGMVECHERGGFKKRLEVDAVLPWGTLSTSPRQNLH
jgi:hypothetical protein